MSLSNQAGWKDWAGSAFECTCYKHIKQILRALNIDPGAHVGTWRYSTRRKDDLEGAQIDLLFDRPDGVITICEIKYSENHFSIDKPYYQELVRKMEVFRRQTRTKKQLFLAMMTTHGLKTTIHSEDLVRVQVTLEDLFRKT